MKYAYGKGIGKPGKVDDWEAKKAKQRTTKAPKKEPKSHSIDTDETGGFGSDFDPAEWV